MVNEFEQLQYQTGFGNEFASSDPRVPDALPVGQNSPQVCPHGLYAENITGTSFTAPRSEARRTWLYRIRPSVVHRPFKRIEAPFLTSDFSQGEMSPNQLRWHSHPMPPADKEVDFVQGLYSVCGGGDVVSRSGVAIHNYSCNSSMKNKAMYNSDGDFLIVPQEGPLEITTEAGRMLVSPLEIAVIPHGMKFSVDIRGPSRGYILEIYGTHFVLPDLGPIGSNGLANPRDFLTPVAWFEDRDIEGFQIINKYQGALFAAEQDHSPFDVVAWHGNHVPYKYDLRNFNTIYSVSYDTSDPSITTVLTAPSSKSGYPVVDFAIFPSRWDVAEHTFRLPYYHRNQANEFLGLVTGIREGVPSGYWAGGASLYSCMTPHGPGAVAFQMGSTAELVPVKYNPGAMPFMFETFINMSVAPWAMQTIDKDYYKEFITMKKNFKMP